MLFAAFIRRCGQAQAGARPLPLLTALLQVKGTHAGRRSAGSEACWFISEELNTLT